MESKPSQNGTCLVRTRIRNVHLKRLRNPKSQRVELTEDMHNLHCAIKRTDALASSGALPEVALCFCYVDYNVLGNYELIEQQFPECRF